MTKCTPIFLLPDEEDFGARRAVTSEMLRRFCRSIEYLYERMEAGEDALIDSLDPEVRKRFKPPAINPMESYGYAFDSGRNAYKFSTQTSDSFSFTVVNEKQYTDLIDWKRTTATVNFSEGSVHIPRTKTTNTGILAENTGPRDKFSLNTYWYVGYNKDKPYKTTKSWLENPFQSGIPSVARAQTFTATRTTYIKRVILKMHGTNKAQTPVYVEIRDTAANGAPGSRVLGRLSWRFSHPVKGELVAFQFQHPIPVQSGTKYAIVVRAPLTSYANHYGLGGWSAHCGKDSYPGGDAYTSYDNGYTWMKHGKSEVKLPYGEGKYKPRDFAFQIDYVDHLTSYPTNQYYYLYLKTLRNSPISYLKLIPTQETPSGTEIKWEVSTDNRQWIEASNNEFTINPSRRFLFVRAKMRTTSSSLTPKITGLTCNMNLDPPTEAYLRTVPYNPPMGTILGANIWSRVNVDYETEPNTEVKVDLIQGTPREEMIPISNGTVEIQLSMLPARPLIGIYHYPSASDPVELYEDAEFTVNYDEGKITIVNPSGLAGGYVSVRYYPVFIKGLKAENMTLPFKLDLLKETFPTDGTRTRFQLSLPMVDPLHHVKLSDTVLEEDKDFTVDYDTREVIFSTPPATGTLTVKYTPYLTDRALMMGIWMKRTNTTNQAYVKGCYFQYRV